VSDNNPFSVQLPALQLAWDSVSSGLFKECARKYELAIVQGWQSRERSIDLDFGIALHSARETYYRSRARGTSHDEGVENAVAYALRTTWDEQLGRPWQGDERKNRFTLVRTLIWLLDEWEDDTLTTLHDASGTPLVERSFRFGLGIHAGTGEEFILAGHLDRVVDYAGLTFVVDLKTTKSSLDEGSRAYFFAQFSPDNQVSLYTFASKIVLSRPAQGVIIDAAQVAVTFSRFARGNATRSASQLAEWHRGFVEMLRDAERYARDAFWPMNERACFRCAYRAVCSLPPAGRASALARDYVKRHWNPLDVRGET